MIHLLVATRNLHKAREIEQILGEQFKVANLSDHPEFPDTIESGTTFEENAVLKAVAVSKVYPGLVLADDSGLEVNALSGAPGVFSARYARVGATGEENISKLLDQLASRSAGSGQTTARFCCVIALARGGKLVATFDGTVHGEVLNTPRGKQGFGYDPVFVPSGFTQTFAELPIETKNQISHRAKALSRLKKYVLTDLSVASPT